jgi:hypothetical protein
MDGLLAGGGVDDRKAAVVGAATPEPEVHGLAACACRGQRCMVRAREPDALCQRDRECFLLHWPSYLNSGTGSSARLSPSLRCWL